MPEQYKLLFKITLGAINSMARDDEALSSEERNIVTEQVQSFYEALEAENG